MSIDSQMSTDLRKPQDDVVTKRIWGGFTNAGLVAIDAMTDMNLDAHVNSVTRIFPRLVETGTTGKIVALLAGRA